MDSYKQIYINWKSWKWVNGTTNCKEEQECEIISSIFTKPTKEKFFKLKIKRQLVCTSEALIWHEDENTRIKKVFLDIQIKISNFNLVKRFYLGKKYIFYPYQNKQSYI